MNRSRQDPSQRPLLYRRRRGFRGGGRGDPRRQDSRGRFIRGHAGAGRTRDAHNRIEGRAAVPGFVDGHPHMDGVGLRFLKPSFDGAGVDRRRSRGPQARGWTSASPANRSSAIRLQASRNSFCLSRRAARRPLAQPARSRQGLSRQPRLYRAARADRSGLCRRQQRRHHACRVTAEAPVPPAWRSTSTPKASRPEFPRLQFPENDARYLRDDPRRTRALLHDPADGSGHDEPCGRGRHARLQPGRRHRDL